MTTRRDVVRTLGLAAIGAPFVNLNRYRLFGDAEYSARCVKLVQESIVVDMLGLLSLDARARRSRTYHSRFSHVRRAADRRTRCHDQHEDSTRCVDRSHLCLAANDVGRWWPRGFLVAAPLSHHGCRAQYAPPSHRVGTNTSA